MKVDQHIRAPRDAMQQWFSDPAELLRTARDTTEHWAQLPEIPGYDQMVEIKRGGQGVVYRARQRSTNRTVAIKILLDGVFASEDRRLRFEREIELVARLKHPNIVPIYDSGVTPDGHLFYVMEYVFGSPLDDSSVLQSHDLRARLALVAQVCDAVHDAHLRGVIHRDLKPSNILIDEAGNPRVLDFGLAKLTSESSGGSTATDRSISQTGQLLGSLPWTSPEQLDGNVDRIDIRSDVYSLGVILYQLTVGRLPYGASPELRQTINEIAAASPPRPRSVRRDIPGDVETIVLRCLAAEPERRYQAVGDLAGDIRRFLRGDPIDAKRDRKWYVLRKTLARHKVVTGLSLALLFSAAGFAVTMTILYQRATDAETLANANLHAARSEAARVETVRAFLEHMLSSADPSVSAEHSLTVREMLTAAARQVGTRFADHPDLEADVRSVIGSAYRGLGLWTEAEAQQRRALDLHRTLHGDDHPVVALNLCDLGGTLLEQRRFAEAEEMLQRALATSVDQLGPDDAQVAACRLKLADLRHGQLRFDEANEHYARAHDILRNCFGPDDDRTITTLIQWTDLLVNMGAFERAAQRIATALSSIRSRSSREDPLLSRALLSAGLVKMYQRDFDGAVATLESAARSQLAIFGDSHPRLAKIYNLMGDVRREQGRYAEAESSHRIALAVCERRIGRESPEGARSLWAMGQARWRNGEFDAAENVLMEAIEIRRRLYEPEHHLVSMSLLQLGKMECEADRHEQAAPLLEEAMQLTRIVYGAEHAMAISTSVRLSACLIHLGRYRECEQLLRSAYSAVDAVTERTDSRRIQLLRALIDLYASWDRPDAADSYRDQLGDLEARLR